MITFVNISGGGAAALLISNSGTAKIGGAY